jgi:hypothetical protein
MSEARDLMRELLDRATAPCTSPVCNEEYHMCEFGQCCDACDMAEAAAGGLQIIYDKHFEAASGALEDMCHMKGALTERQAAQNAATHVRAAKVLDIITADAKVALTACAKSKSTCCSDNPGADAGCCPDSLREEPL